MSHKKTKNKKSKKNKRRNLFINILAGFLILLSLALIFNSKIRDIFLVWNTNKYQVNQVTNLPIFKGLDNVNLFYGAGTMKPDQKMGEGNYSLASHHIFTAENASQMLFSPLVNAKAGMKIYLTDKDKVYTYEITEVKRVTPDRVDEIEDRDGVKEITLVTCVDYNATERIIVKGIFKESKAYSETSEDILKAFNQPYRQRY